MSNLEIITKILNDQFLSEDQSAVVERDKREDGSVFQMKFRIVKTPEIEYKLYRFESKDFPFFSDVKGMKKMCDFILISEEREHLRIFLIELKLGPSSAKQQLDAAYEFAMFILNSSKRIGQSINNYSIKKIRICQSSLTKRKNMAIENNYTFDENDYLDYKLQSIHLKNLM